MGYYETPKKCNQTDIAEFFGLKQATVAEHLQHAENIILNSWAKQVPSSKPSKRN
jgi:predicted DNA binding protein